MPNRVQDNKTELQTELSKLKASKPRDMPQTMMRIHQIHNKLIHEGDNEKERMNIVFQLTHIDIFDMLPYTKKKEERKTMLYDLKKICNKYYYY